MKYRDAFTVGTHVDDILARGHRRTTEAFWASVKNKFDVKSWDIVDYDNPMVYCAKRISKIKREGKPWYTVDQTEDIKDFLFDNDMACVGAQQAQGYAYQT